MKQQPFEFRSEGIYRNDYKGVQVGSLAVAKMVGGRGASWWLYHAGSKLLVHSLVSKRDAKKAELIAFAEYIQEKLPSLWEWIDENADVFANKSQDNEKKQVAIAIRAELIKVSQEYWIGK